MMEKLKDILIKQENRKKEKIVTMYFLKYNKIVSQNNKIKGNIMYFYVQRKHFVQNK